MIRKIYFFILFFSIFIFFNSMVWAEVPAPIPRDGTSPQECDVAWNKELDDKGQTVVESLRHRIELYNSSDLCRFRIFFLFKDQTIVLQKPLVLEKNLHDRGTGVFTGTYIDGYGTKGISEKLNITLDALKLTQDKAKCAFVIKGGLSAKQQIHGLNLKVADAARAICDENGQDLLALLSPNCPGKQGKDCDFKDVTVLVPELPGPPDPVPADSDGDGVGDANDQCPNTTAGTKVDDKGCSFVDPSDPGAIDSDSDGVVDAKDECPATAKGAKVDEKGCPLAQSSDKKGDAAVDQSNLSDCQLARVDGEFSFARVFSPFVALLVLMAMKKFSRKPEQIKVVSSQKSRKLLRNLF